MTKQHANTLAKLTIAAAFFAILVIGKGAYTRLTDAGLGCPDWPGCYGFLTVPSGEKIEIAEQAFPDTPVESFKAWVEMIHRYMATFLGLLIVAILVLGLRWAPKDPDQRKSWPVKHLWALFGMVCLQGAFGAWTVTLKVWPLVVTGHLIGGFTVLTLMTLLAVRFMRFEPEAKVDSQQASQLRSLIPLGWIAMAALCVQIFLGGWTSTNYAALACPDLPTCQGQWVPPTDFKAGFDFLQDIGPNYLGGQMDNEARVAIHLTHRIGAIVVLLLMGAMALLLIKRGGGTAYRNYGFAMLGFLTLQILLGLSNIYYQLPLSVATAHNVVAAILLQSSVLAQLALYRVARTELQSNPNSGWAQA